MIVRCWGARGSIPVSGPEYVRYGGDSTCIEIRSKSGEVIVIDAGSGIRRLGNRLLEEECYDFSLIFTHSHWDHVLGFPFFKPIYSDKTNVNLYGCSFSQGNMEKLLGHTMSPPYFPVPYQIIAASIHYHEICGEPFDIGGVCIESIPLSHPNMGLGYGFEEDGKRFVLLTDNELSFKHRGGGEFADYLEFSKGADLLFHDAEYTDEDYIRTRGWGHTTYREALRLAMEAGVARFGLFHHNQDRQDAQLDAIVAECRETVMRAGVEMDVFALTQDTEIVL